MPMPGTKAGQSHISVGSSSSNSRRLL